MEALSGWIQFLYSSLFRNTRKLLLYLKINLLSIQKLQVQLQVQDFVSSSDVLRCLTELLSFGLLNFPNIIWTLKDNKKEFNVNWQILKRAISYTGGSKRCNLCLEEKFCILKEENKDCLLNKRVEIISTCRHGKKFRVNVNNANNT
jgi:hypothetical protein